MVNGREVEVTVPPDLEHAFPSVSELSVSFVPVSAEVCVERKSVFVPVSVEAAEDARVLNARLSALIRETLGNERWRV